MCEDDGRDWSAYVINCQILIEGLNRFIETVVESSAKLDITAESVCKEYLFLINLLIIVEMKNQFVEFAIF